MSRSPIRASSDLQKLRDEGYDLEVRDGALLFVKDVPYVAGDRSVKRGILVSKLTLAGDQAAYDGQHVAYWIGEWPCDASGSKMDALIHQQQEHRLSEGVIAPFSFSRKPQSGYKDYYHKMRAYSWMLAAPARKLQPGVTPCTFPVVQLEPDESVFEYEDTASIRSEIAHVVAKLKGMKIAIVGCGGTASYILDFVAKTPVGEIHIFDGDAQLSHNAFRSPGAASIEELRAKLNKATYLKRIYSRMHRKIFDHPYYLTESRVGELSGMAFVFLAVDSGAARKPIVEGIERMGLPFVDVGMGLAVVEGTETLRGELRVTMSTPNKRDHVRTRRRIPMADAGVANEYITNIQIAELNALNAALAVIKWKKYVGIYADVVGEHHAKYVVEANEMITEDV